MIAQRANAVGAGAIAGTGGARLHLRRGGRLAADAGLRPGAQGRQAAGADDRDRSTRSNTATARLEIDPTLIQPGERIIIVDDLIATGGTALAAAQLLRQAGAVVDRALFVIDLPDLGGAKLLEANGIAVEALMEFEGD